MSSKDIKFIIFVIALFVLGIFFSSELIPLENFFYKVFAPINKGVSGATGSLKDFFVSLGSIGKLSGENTRLEKENNELKAKIAQIEEIKHENEILKKQLGFIESYQERELIPAKIIGYSPTGYFQSLKVDKGIKDGVKKGKAVLSEGYLVGVVEETGQDYAEILPLTSSRSLVAVLLQESRGTGLLHGGLKGMIIEDIPLDTMVVKGEQVMTSGLGDDLPPSINIGIVNEIISSQSEIFQRVSVKSPLEYSDLEFVFIVK